MLLRKASWPREAVFDGGRAYFGSANCDPSFRHHVGEFNPIRTNLHVLFCGHSAGRSKSRMVAGGGASRVAWLRGEP